MCPDNAAPGNAAGTQCVWGGEEEGEGEVVEQQIRALGNPVPLSPRLLLRCVSGGGSITNSTLGSAVQYLYN